MANRRVRLRAFFDGKTLPQLEKSYISQLITGAAAFGEKAARRLEHTYGMGDHFLDMPASDSPYEPQQVMRPSIMSEPSPVPYSANNQNPVWANDYVLIDALTNQLGAGSCAVLHEFDEVDGQRAYRRDWLEKNNLQASALKVVTVKGDSMVPYVFHSNKVLINTLSKRIIDGEHYAIRVGSEPKVKRLFTQGDGKIRVESYNAPTDFISGEDDAEVLGLVVDRNGTSWRGL